VTDFLLNCLRAGNTRRDACICAGVSEDTLARWRRNSADFAYAVAQAEAECKAGFVAALTNAALGSAVTETQTTKTVMHRLRCVARDAQGHPLRNPDGKVVLEDKAVPFEEVTTSRTTRPDWRAGLEWLKRRRRDEWGDQPNPDLDREIAEYMALLAAAHSAEPSNSP
jgi:hypothetical protein